MMQRYSSSVNWYPNGVKILSRSWLFLLGFLFLTTKMNLVNAEAETVLQRASSPIPQQEIDDFMTYLLNSEGSWQGHPFGGVNSDDPVSRSKKHLGSVAAASGLRRPTEDEIGRFNAQARGQLSFKRGIPPTLRKYFFGQGTGSSAGGNAGSVFRQNKRSSDESESAEPQTTFPQDFLTQESESRSPFREKRFMGALARGGWFPREFRGYVASPQWDKRHVGAFARLGWMPHSKFTNRGSDLSDLKRNLGSLRKSQIWIPKEERMWEE